MITYLIMVIIGAALAMWVLNRSNGKIKGPFGEKHVAKILTNLDSDEYTILNDLYLPKENGETTQIDHIVLSSKGLFVIETKNYNGVITGAEQKEFWKQTNQNRNDQIYNPIWENAGHIKALQACLGKSSKNVHVHSIIVFGPDTQLEYTQPFKQAAVINSSNVLNEIQSAKGPNMLSHFHRQKLKQLLSAYFLYNKKGQTDPAEINERNHTIKGNIYP
ncbi:nuclease-related domain-containing protein [Mesobacillus harenae]|uniref:nuclease-related domain-containing protein n=1 Tax=Mesobacillus harenae TaxID=2213203 RepID=UPI00157FBEAC|nr:nuclease-related domain-containing protein [Mesobacillus harenae]